MEMHFILTLMFQPPGYAMAYVTKYGTYTMREGVTRDQAFKEILTYVADQANVHPDKGNVVFFSLESNVPDVPAGTPNGERG